MSFETESIALLREMVSIPSESFKESEVADLIFGKMEVWGLAPKRFGNNIVACSAGYNPTKPTLVMDAHIDTVPAAEGYSRNAFDPGQEENVIYGLGANDDGGSVVAMIATLRHFREKNLPVNLVIALSGEEECSGAGGATFLYSSNGPEEVRDSRWAIIGEPTGMKVATSERGLLVLDGLACGQSGHAARNEGVNALYIALEDISRLREYNFDRISPAMGKVNLNVTQINAGSAHNIIPDRCSFVVDIRPTEQYGNKEILDCLQALCHSTLKARNLSNRSSATFAGSPLLSTASALGFETFSSPTTSNWMRTGKDAIKLGPGESSRSHKADEFILTAEITDAIEKYTRFIETFCYGNSLE